MNDEHEISTVYLDWQTETNPLGECILNTKIRDGYTFILDEEHEDKSTRVYSYERWNVTFIVLTDLGKTIYKVGQTADMNIRYLYNIGTTKSRYKPEYDEPIITLYDKFLKVDGVEVF